MACEILNHYGTHCVAKTALGHVLVSWESLALVCPQCSRLYTKKQISQAYDGRGFCFSCTGRCDSARHDLPSSFVNVAAWDQAQSWLETLYGLTLDPLTSVVRASLLLEDLSALRAGLTRELFE